MAQELEEPLLNGHDHEEPREEENLLINEGGVEGG